MSKLYLCPSQNDIDEITITARINDSAFRFVKSLEKVIIDNDDIEISDLAFEDCSFLKTVVLSANIKKISFAVSAVPRLRKLNRC